MRGQTGALVSDPRRLTRRSLIVATAGAATGFGLSGCRGSATTMPTTTPASGTPTPQPSSADQVRLGAAAARAGLEFRTSAATWQLADSDYSKLVAAQSGVVLTEDHLLLWYRLRPSPKAALDFSYADAFFQRAEKHRQRVVGAHVMWDEGFGDGLDDPRRSTG
jgi:endo-1,4-beta-xylanase